MLPMLPLQRLVQPAFWAGKVPGNKAGNYSKSRWLILLQDGLNRWERTLEITNSIKDCVAANARTQCSSPCSRAAQNECHALHVRYPAVPNEMPPIAMPLRHLRRSLKPGRGKAPVGGDGHAVNQVPVGIRRPGDGVLVVVGDGPCGEAVAGAKGAVPAGADGVRPAADAVGRPPAGLGALDAVGAVDDGAQLRVDAKRHPALGVGSIAGPLERLDDPRGRGAAGGDGLGLGIDRGSGGSESSRGSGKEADEGGGEMHGGRLVVVESWLVKLQVEWC